MLPIKEALPGDLGYHAGLSELETHCPAVIPSFNTEGEFDQWCVGYCDGLGVELVDEKRSIADQARAYVLEKNNA